VEDQPFFHGGNPEAFDFPGFRVALAIASLPGMTIELCNELQKHYPGGSIILNEVKDLKQK